MSPGNEESEATQLKIKIGIWVAMLVLPMVALADKLNMPIGVTQTSREIYSLHMLIFWVCVAIGVVVFLAMFYSIVMHRKSRGVTPATFHESTTMEILWTIIPVVILVAMAYPATRVLIDIYDTGGEDMAIEVRAYQWKWQYKYLDDDFNRTFDFFSVMNTPLDQIEGRQEKGDTYMMSVDNPLRIPVNRKVRFLITSDDVIHSWWVPDFGVKRDAVPGILNDVWTIVDEPGVYRGQCTELCGKDHAFMPVVVEVLPEEEYDAWYQERVQMEVKRREALSKTFSPDELLAQGETIYQTFCSSCHQPDGNGLPPAFPGLAGSPVTTGDRDAHVKLVIEGVPGTAMQAFGRQLDAVQIAAVVHYERHAFGNNAGDITQPKDVINLMSGETP
jgi:cytochrome c oxidase subunit 2